jgi:hypothetical protein
MTAIVLRAPLTVAAHHHTTTHVPASTCQS